MVARFFQYWGDMIPQQQIMQVFGVIIIFYVFMTINGVLILRSVYLEADYFGQMRNSAETLFMLASRDSLDDVI